VFEMMISKEKVTGPNIALAITLIKRLKELFLNPDSRAYQLVFDTR
jgi:hypothetical protein